MAHRPPKIDGTNTVSLDNITNSGLFPNDILENPEKYFADAHRVDIKDMCDIIKKAQGNPDAEITIYRGSPINELNKGDWVTLSKDYAKRYAGMMSENPKSKLYKYQVKAKDISFNNSSFIENGYWGDKMKG